MDSTQSAPAVRQKKGIKKLWAKIKASMKSGPATSQPSATTTASTPAQSSVPSRPAQTTASTTAVTEPTVQSEPASVQSPEPSKAEAQPSIQAASSHTQTQEPTKTMQEETAAPLEPANEIEAATPRAGLPDMSDVIEVDENEDEEYPYVDSTSSCYATNFFRIQLPQRYLSAASADDKARFSRAQAIFQKYNMTLHPADWHAPSRANVERVPKRKRQRVHWTCHECKSGFGSEKICRHCSHIRCSTCVRYPPKKVGQKKQQRSKNIEPPVSTIVADLPTTGACHECKTDFTMGDPVCRNCDHQICERCLKETIVASPATAPPGSQNVNVAAAS